MLVEAKTLSKHYGETVTAVDAVTITLSAGDFTALHGPSGCGKSTLLLMLGGLSRPDSGAVSICDQDIYALSPNGRARHRAEHVGFVFQDANLLPFATVLDNVLAATLAKSMDSPEARAREILVGLGLGERLTHKPRELSAGEQQRVALARALFHQPQILLADEPTGNLDSDNAALVLDAFRSHADGGGCVLMVTHDATARSAANNALEMQAGAIAKETS